METRTWELIVHNAQLQETRVLLFPRIPKYTSLLRDYGRLLNSSSSPSSPDTDTASQPATWRVRYLYRSVWIDVCNDHDLYTFCTLMRAQVDAQPWVLEIEQITVPAVDGGDEETESEKGDEKTAAAIEGPPPRRNPRRYVEQHTPLVRRTLVQALHEVGYQLPITTNMPLSMTDLRQLWEDNLPLLRLVHECSQSTRNTSELCEQYYAQQLNELSRTGRRHRVEARFEFQRILFMGFLWHRIKSVLEFRERQKKHGHAMIMQEMQYRYLVDLLYPMNGMTATRGETAKQKYVRLQHVLEQRTESERMFMLCIAYPFLLQVVGHRVCIAQDDKGVVLNRIWFLRALRYGILTRICEECAPRDENVVAPPLEANLVTLVR